MGYKQAISLDNEIERSEDYSLQPGTRSAIRHGLIESAQTLNELATWNMVGNTLIRAAQVDDLSSNVSDHFVRVCPQEVFSEFPFDNAACRFRRWREKTRYHRSG